MGNNNKIMSGLSVTEKQLVTENRHGLVVIDGEEHKVENFCSKNNQNQQQMKRLIEAIREQLGIMDDLFVLF
ncbi:hypothetical protein C5167_040884 [Papaver somniferum]|uniref:Uncharacterized protein n=1 Tax=Papaver somniferum TaxID=3469 RepID=A0A4Y7IJQ3_PAPSO|nr:hypothetical protein C5167_040884 [Papaver somniferum]